MKKKLIRDAIYYGVATKTWKVMRLSVFFLFLFLSQVWAGSSYSQQTKLSLKMDNARIIEILDKIEDNSEFYFLFNQKLVDVERRVDIDFEKKAITEILDELFEETDVDYLVKDRQIVLTTEKVESKPVEQQKKSVTGKVTDEKGESLPGVTVLVKGTTNGTVTNMDGEFSITGVSPETVLQISFVGMKTQDIVVGSQNKINVTLRADAIGLEEVVAIGYATVKKVNVTGSVAAVDFEDLESVPSSNAASMMQGRISGVNISNFSTQPGNDDPQILIRGMGTLNSGANPLVIVDGVESSLGQIPASDIKSISVLKDAASASIYGVRAANGVILVTTKTGKTGKTKVSFNTNIGFQQNLKDTELLGSVDFANIKNAWAEAEGTTPWYTDEEIQLMANGSAPDLFANTNWLDEAYRTALMQTYHISVSGGNDKVTYMLSSEYFDQEGIMVGTSSRRLNIRSNVNVKVNDKLKVGLNLFGYRKRIEEPVSAAAGVNDQGLNYWLRRSTMPTVPVYYSSGDYGFYDGAYDRHNAASRNILFDANLGDRYSILNRQEGKVYLDYDIIKGLHFKTSFAFITNSTATSKFNPTSQKKDAAGNIVTETTKNSLTNTDRRSFKYQVENVLTYTKSFNKHQLNFLLGQSAQEYRLDYNKGYVEDFPNNNIHVLGAGVSNPKVDGWAYENSIYSYFGRVNYSFDDKYLFEFNLRRDGSSRMPSENRFGIFPSFSAGWIVTNESFLSNTETIDLLKLRASWGQLGNQEIGEYAYAQSFATGYNYVIDGELAGGVAISELANQDIKWEKTTITDIGFDMNLFDNKVTIVADWFEKSSTDVLLRLPIPLSVGVDLAPYQNVGEVQNKGWETAVGYRNKFGELSLFANVNFSQVKNEIVDIGGREDWINGETRTINQVGSPIGSYYGLVADGYLSESDFDASGDLIDGLPTQYGGLKPGDIKYKDISGPDGVPDGKISEDYDRQIIGNPFPDFTYGFTLGGEFKGFDLSVFFQGVHGIDRWQWYNNEANGNYTTAILDYWTPSNTDASYPSLGNFDNNAKYSTFWLQDASYLRLKNLEIGYTLPESIVSKAKISNARIYFTGQNLLTFTDMVDYDPERRADDVRAGSYAQAKVYSFGLNLTF